MTEQQDNQFWHEFQRPAAGWENKGNGGVYAPIDASTNKALPWAVLAAMFGGMGFAGVLVLSMLKPWETADRAARAELRAEFAELLAEQQSAIDRAKQDAAIAKDWTDQKNAELKVYRGAK